MKHDIGSDINPYIRRKISVGILLGPFDLLTLSLFMTCLISFSLVGVINGSDPIGLGKNWGLDIFISHESYICEYFAAM